MTPTAVQAIKDRGAVFTSEPIYWPNETFEPPADASGNPRPFVWAEIRGLSSEIRSIGTPGAHWLRDHGFIRFHVEVPSGEGTDRAYALAETLAAIYRISSFSGVQTLAPTPAEGGEGSDDGNWFAVSFSVPFYFDYQG